MKRFWTAIAVAFTAVMAVSGCNDYGNTFQGNTGAAISLLSPSNVNAGRTTNFTLVVSGSGFVTQTYITWNGKKLATTVQTDSNNNVLTVSADITPDLVAKSGTVTIITQNPFSGSGNNGLSNPLQFTINPPANPVPVLSSISPTCLSAGTASSQTLTLNGSSFLLTSDPSGGSQVHWNAAVQTTLQIANITASQIQATIPSSLLATAGSATVTVYNPPAAGGSSGGVPDPSRGGGGSSSGQTFTISSGACPSSAAKSTTVGPVGNVAEETAAVSLDGRYVAFVAAQTQGDQPQIFLRDTCEGATASCQPGTTLLSVAASGASANDESHSPSISADGRYVAFSSAATNLVSSAPPGRQIYLRDTCAGVSASCQPSTQLISTDANGALGGTESILPSVSASGRFIAFLAVTPSHAANTIKGQTISSPSAVNSGLRQVFVRDTCAGASNCTPSTKRISLQPSDGSGSGTKQVGPALSGNAKAIAMNGRDTTMLFTHSVAVDDRVFLAITDKQP